MRKLTIPIIKRLLTEQLKLKSPDFHLSVGRTGHINGQVVSESFEGKGDRQRQGMIWDVLAAIVGNEEAEKQVGFIMALTPFEWNLDEILVPTEKSKRKKAG